MPLQGPSPQPEHPKPATLTFQRISEAAQDTDLNARVEEFPEGQIKEASLSLEDSARQPHKDMLLYLVTPSGGQVEVANPPKELRVAIENAREKVKQYLQHLNQANPDRPKLAFKNMDFKYLTCEAYKGDSLDTEFVNIPLSEEIEEVRDLLAKHGFMPRENWPKMSPEQISFAGTGMRVIGNLENFSGKFGKFLESFENPPKPKEIRKYLQELPKEEIHFDFAQAEKRIGKLETAVGKKIEVCRKDLRDKKDKIKALREQVNQKDPPPDVENINAQIRKLDAEITAMNKKIETYQILQKKTFALSWVIMFRHSSLDNLPLLNARQSYGKLKEFISEKGGAIARNNPKKVNAYCAEVSAMLIPNRGERVQFLRECSTEYRTDLQELSLDEQLLHDVMQDEIPEYPASESPMAEGSIGRTETGPPEQTEGGNIEIERENPQGPEE